MKPAHKLGMMYMMAAAMNDQYPVQRNFKAEREQSASSKEWKRKKCKTCKHLQPMSRCDPKGYTKPRNKACKKWKGK